MDFFESWITLDENRSKGACVGKSEDVLGPMTHVTTDTIAVFVVVGHVEVLFVRE